MLMAGTDSASVVRIAGLSQEMVSWLHDHVEYERGSMLVSPPVMLEQPARWLSAMRWISHCQATERKRKMEASKRG